MEQQKNEPALKPKELNALKRELNKDLIAWSPMKGSDSKSKLSKWSFMSGCKITFRGELPASTHFSVAAEVEFYGGQLAENESKSDVTHVVIAEINGNGNGGNEKPSTRGKSSKGASAFIVSTEWLMESLARKEMQPESRYEVTI